MKYILATSIPLFLFSSNCLADYRHFLWMPQQHGNITVPDIILDDTAQSAKGVASGGLNGKHDATILMSRCSGGNDSLQGKQTKNSWLILPREVRFNGIVIQIALSGNGWNNAEGSGEPEFTAKVYQTISDGALSGCWSIAHFGPATFTWRDANVTVTVPKQSLPPGEYSVPVTYYYAFEEHKFSGASDGEAGNIAAMIRNDARSRSTFYINMTVTSRCEISSGNDQKIDLSHGTILTNDLREHKTPSL